MGADNWGTCPNCKKAAEASKANAIKAAEEAYGNVPYAEHQELMIEASRPITLNTEMREDYELGTDEDGEFCVSYSCGCKVCGFKFDFKHSEQVVNP